MVEGYQTCPKSNPLVSRVGHQRPTNISDDPTWDEFLSYPVDWQWDCRYQQSQEICHLVVPWNWRQPYDKRENGSVQIVAIAIELAWWCFGAIQNTSSKLFMFSPPVCALKQPNRNSGSAENNGSKGRRGSKQNHTTTTFTARGSEHPSKIDCCYCRDFFDWTAQEVALIARQARLHQQITAGKGKMRWSLHCCWFLTQGIQTEVFLHTLLVYYNRIHVEPFEAYMLSRVLVCHAPLGRKPTTSTR